jgi:hypothetical protein
VLALGAAKTTCPPLPAEVASASAIRMASCGPRKVSAPVTVHCTAPRARSLVADFRLADGDPLPATAVVALPRLTGPAVSRLPQDGEGFVPVDDRGRVLGEDGAYAVGDMTTHPMCQGALATQQADAVAHSIAFAEGADVEPRPYRPSLHGMLLTGNTPLYLHTDRDPNEAPAAFWWPAHKISAATSGPISPRTRSSAGRLAQPPPPRVPDARARGPLAAPLSKRRRRTRRLGRCMSTSIDGSPTLRCASRSASSSTPSDHAASPLAPQQVAQSVQGLGRRGAPPGITTREAVDSVMARTRHRRGSPPRYGRRCAGAR